MNNLEMTALAVTLGFVFGDTGNFIILLLTLEVYFIRAALLEQIEVIQLPQNILPRFPIQPAPAVKSIFKTMPYFIFTFCLPEQKKQVW